MVELLDCTFRDGGYYTNWDFDPALVRAYLTSMARLPVRHVEFGYVNDPQPGYAGEFFFLSRDKLRQARAALRPDQKLVVMIDGKGTTPARMGPLFGHLAGIVDMVRITVAPDKLDHGIALGRALKAAGLGVGFNVMYLSTFQNDLGKIAPAFAARDAYDSLALVDSYGGCTPGRVEVLFRELRDALPGMPIGFHGHDNMCLAMANSIAAIEGGADVIDGTLVGMGRGAGNLRIEAMLAYLGGRQGGNAVVDYQALSAVVEPFEALQRQYGWGTNLPYMISGVNNLPQRDVMDWISKKRYSVMSIVQALQQQSMDTSDMRDHPPLPAMQDPARPVLVVGGGPSVPRHLDAIARYVARTGALVLFSSSRHMALAEALGGEQMLCLPGHDAMRAEVTPRLGRLTAAIVSTPPRVQGCLPEGFRMAVLQTAPLTAGGAPGGGPVSDISPLDLAFGAVAALGARECLLVGFDGYETASAAEQTLAQEVQSMLDSFRARYPQMRLRSLTPTRYDVDGASVYAEVAALG